MKKLIKYIFVFIMGGLVFGTLGIFAYTYTANDIVYTPSNNSCKVDSVKSAIDSIKNTNDTTIANLQSSNNTKDETITSLNSQITELSKYDQCVYGSIVLQASNKQLIEDKLAPTVFVVWGVDKNGSYFNNLYNRSVNQNNGILANGSSFTMNQASYIIENNSLYIGSSVNIPQYYGVTMYYVACK